MKMKIQFISAGFRSVLFSPGVKTLLQNQAEQVRNRATANAGSGEFSTSTIAGNYGGGRWVAFVQTADRDAAKAESEYKALSKAVR